MTDSKQEKTAEMFYYEGMSFNWRHPQSPDAITHARAALHEAANRGHAGALRELSDMYCYPEGGAQDQELALILMWSAFRKGDHEALEALGDMLETYGETSVDKELAKDAIAAARRVEEINKQLENVHTFIQGLKVARSTRKENK